MNNFEPTNSFAGRYYSYGTNGGLTPTIQVEYRYLNVVDYTNTATYFNGPGSVLKWDVGYSTLTNVIYNQYPGTGMTTNNWWAEVRLIPTAASGVKLLSFDTAEFGAPVAGQTLLIVQNANSSPTLDVLWSAGTTEGTTIGAAVSNHLVNISVEGTNTLSLVFGQSSFWAVDNIVFAVPEPTTLALMSGVGLVTTIFRRRR